MKQITLLLPNGSFDDHLPDGWVFATDGSKSWLEGPGGLWVVVTLVPDRTWCDCNDVCENTEHITDAWVEDKLSSW